MPLLNTSVVLESPQRRLFGWQIIQVEDPGAEQITSCVLALTIIIIIIIITRPPARITTEETTQPETQLFIGVALRCLSIAGIVPTQCYINFFISTTHIVYTILTGYLL